MEWFVVDNNPTGRKLAKWQRSVALSNDATIFAPAAMAGNEMMAFLSASWDGARCVVDSKHIYLPIT
jgi:hypothetical protein